MSYPFPEIEHGKVYPKTFLKDVSVYLSFPVENQPKNLNKSLSEYLSKEFNVSEDSKIDIDKINSLQGLKIASSDKCVIFNFFDSAVLLKVKFPAYRSFKNISSLFPKLIGFAKLFDVEVLNCLRITKYNELQFDCKNDSFPVIEIMRHIFSKPLMNEVYPDIPNLSKHPRLERVIDFTDEESNTKVNITYGYVRSDIDPQRGALTLKTSVENKGLLDIRDFDIEIMSYNDLVDRVFHWCVTDEILDKMSN